jgi:hypothetical protein
LSCREGVRRIACLEEAAEKKDKDDATVGRRDLRSGHGVGGAHRLGVDVPGGRQRGRPRHTQRRDRALRRRLSSSEYWIHSFQQVGDQFRSFLSDFVLMMLLDSENC